MKCIRRSCQNEAEGDGNYCRQHLEEEENKLTDMKMLSIDIEPSPRRMKTMHDEDEDKANS